MGGAGTEKNAKVPGLVGRVKSGGTWGSESAGVCMWGVAVGVGEVRGAREKRHG